jgi:hypothetical protein
MGEEHCVTKSGCRSAFFLIALVIAGLSNGVQAELQPRDLNGDLIVDAFYDSALNITWLNDANYAKTSGFDSDGLMAGSTANSFAQGLMLGGYNGWRLAALSTIGHLAMPYNCATSAAFACAASGNELGYMYYFNLDGNGNNSGIQQSGNATLFNIQGNYWGNGATNVSWTLNFANGYQNLIIPPIQLFASGWIVHPGDVGSVISPVPEPQIFSLMLIGIGFVGLKLRRERVQKV